jgi:hypothetical protein|uniref:RNA-directed RNA polymerase n=1 Tax=Leviviridae sp. TaxID=2027243 RepID=A0A514D5F2_9VIRU|nr:MAG: RNA-dependent RNA polymerase [Leviviridae sp.]
MKSLMSLWTVMAEDLAMTCCTSATSDINTVRRRVEDEGLSFLTITLPDLGKSIEKWIDQGRAGINPSFSYGRRGLPVFLRGFLIRVFDLDTGVLLNDPDIDAVFALRQLTLAFGKISLPCSDARERKAMSDFIKCEQEVRESDALLSESDLCEFERISDLLFRKVFLQMDRDVYYGSLLPKHGPGATADKLSSNGKYDMRLWTTRLERYFPSSKYLIPNYRFSDRLDGVTFLEPGDEVPVRVISVPKTLKTPRIIAIEPTCMQYTQQALLRCFLSAFSRDELLKKLIGFDDQTPNQELARQGSNDGLTATLDLSEASDRVSNQLVRRMTRKYRHLHDAIDSCRSRRAEVPGHGVIRLAKYASMGSALCFPVEAMVFTTLIFLGIQKTLNTPLTRKDIKSYSDQVRVYGDDLIVPTRQVRTIVSTLEHFGARVGRGKSFWTGRFRESCGKEYLYGRDVSVTRVRQVLPSTIDDVTEVISTVSLRNQLAEVGCFESTVEWLDNRLRKVMKYFPEVGPDSSVLGRVSPSLPLYGEKMHPRLHIPLVRGYSVQAKAPSDPLGDTGAMLKCLLKLESSNPQGVLDRDIELVPCYWPGLARSERNGSSFRMPSGRQDEKHLERSGRPKRVSIKLGWRPAH